ncbi:MAG: hypothetical protein KAX18_14895, partial [Candidatus Lokiarchaeota archaeon]|nr:hypothetical protein [Candidatus Lokiarchaeota archaeon]
YFVLISRIQEATSDLVIIVDREDIRETEKMIPKIIEIIMEHLDLFINWDHEPEMLEMFDLKIIKLILSNKKLVSESSLTVNQSSILKSIWDQKGSLSEQLRENLLSERENLNIEYLVEENFLKKYEISKTLIEISEKLHDDEKFIEYQTEAKSLRDEIKDRKLRLHYYLDRVKESIGFSKFSETYSYLYSFCLKLKNFAEPIIIERYKSLAKTILNKNKVSKQEFRDAVRDVAMIEDEINKYLTIEI